MTIENNATVVRFEKLPDCLFRIWIRPDWSCEGLQWSPGQFLRIGVLNPGDSKNALRAMTIITISDNVLEFFMVSITEGVTSPKLATLSAGDRCYVEALITGNFHTATLPAATGRDLWMMGTGTGIAPYLAMLKHSKQPLSDFRSLVLVHSVQHPQHLCYQTELAKAAEFYDDLLYVPVVTKATNNTDDRLHQRLPMLIANSQLSAFTGKDLTPQQSVVMLCGHPGMIRDATTQLKALGLTKHRRRAPGNILTERYF